MSESRLFLVRIFSLLGLVALGGCQAIPYQPYARNVKVQPSKGGVVALKLDHRDEDRQKADEIMQRTCADQEVKVLEEGEVAVGTVTKSNSTEKESSGVKVGSLFGLPVTSGTDGKALATESTTIQKKEWQISYECMKVASSKKKSRTL